MRGENGKACDGKIHQSKLRRDDAPDSSPRRKQNKVKSCSGKNLSHSNQQEVWKVVGFLMGHRHKSKQPKMSTLEELELLYTSTAPPINPPNGYEKPDKARAKGYKFYTEIKGKLASWWEEFNGELDEHGRLKYDCVRQFIKRKVTGEEKRCYLYQMIGPVHAREEKSEVPWLGDWDKRRSCGFGVLEQPEKIKPLIRAIKSNLVAAESVKSMTPLLVEDLSSISYLQSKVHEAFAGQPFLKGKSADDKRNVARFNTYKALLLALTQAKILCIDQIMKLHGVDPLHPEQMREMAQIAGGIGAAAALTGMAASQAGISGVRSADGSTIAPYTYDAIKLAEHLTRHAHTFRKPLPPVIDAEISEEDASSSKANGHGRPQ